MNMRTGKEVWGVDRGAASVQKESKERREKKRGGRVEGVYDTDTEGANLETQSRITTRPLSSLRPSVILSFSQHQLLLHY